MTDKQTDLSIVGQSVPRRDGLAQATGQQIYVDDIHLPRMLYARGIFARYPHAKILNVDTSRAEKLTGVKAVVTAKDVPNNRYGIYIKDQPAIVGDKTRYLGDFPVVVAAVDRDTAEEAASLVEIEYEELPAVFDPREAMKPGAPEIHEGGNVVNIGPNRRIQIRKGDVDEGFKRADLILEHTYSTQAMEHAMLEPHTCLVEVDGSGNIKMYTTAQMIFFSVMQIGDVLGIPISKIRGIVPVVGGGFGGKNELSIEMATILLAQKAGRPVKWAWTNEIEFHASSTAHPYFMTHRVGAKNDGTITAWRLETLVDNGAYTRGGPWVLDTHAVMGHGPYKVDNYYFDGYVVYTNNAPGGALRGFGVRQGTFSSEMHMNRLAEALGIDRLDLRLKNALHEGDTISTGQRLQAVAAEEVLRKAAEMAGWEQEVGKEVEA
jgi:nicotinate dehydrogenase large molybdopterin subunit